MPVLWYLLKTWAGREEELVKEVQRILPPQMYEECFVIRQERIWRKQQKSIVHLEALFPGCVFLTCREMEEKSEIDVGEGLETLETVAERRQVLQRLVLHRLEKFLADSRTMAGGEAAISPMTREDGQFLEKISGDEHVVRLSYVQKDEEGNICKLSEPLKVFQGQVERYQFKKRYAMVRHRLWGEERTFVLGIVLNEDGGQKFLRREEQKLWFRGDGIR